MNDSAPGAPEDDVTWTSETLPMSVRRALLERELKKLGLRKAPGSAAHPRGTAQQQQQPQQPQRAQQQQQPQAASEPPRAEQEDDPPGERAD